MYCDPFFTGTVTNTPFRVIFTAGSRTALTHSVLGPEVGVGDTVAEALTVGVAEAVIDSGGVAVGDAAGVEVGVEEGVLLGVDVGDAVGVRVGVTVGVAVGGSDNVT